jgi:microsomal dipeptidase-like Zn-dependent dipeptidase
LVWLHTVVHGQKPAAATHRADALIYEEKVRDEHPMGTVQDVGYTEADLKKLLGENLLRVWAEVETTAERLREEP